MATHISRESNRATAERIPTVLARVLLYLLLTGMAVIILAPLIWTVSTSLKSYDQVFVWPPRWMPSPIVWENYPNAWQAAPFARYYLNTFILAIGVVIGRLAVCSLAAYSLGRLQFPGRDIFFILFLSTMMLPGQVTLIPLFLITKSLGWLNTYQGLIVPDLTSAYSVFFLRQFFRTIPMDLDDAARLDGASRLRALMSIILPLSVPALTVVAVFSFNSGWGSFLWPLIITTRADMRTIEVGMAFFQDAHGGVEYPLLMAANTMALILVIIIFLIGQRQFVSGITLTGMKG